jgi:hypothetical protein
MPAVVSFWGPVASLTAFGDTEIGDQRVAAGEHHVVRLDVAVDDAVAVRLGQRIHHFPENADRFRDRQLAVLLQPFPQRFALDVGHDVVVEAGGLAGIEQRQDVGMLERAATWISRKNRSLPRLAARSGRSTFTATLRSCLRSWAR